MLKLSFPEDEAGFWVKLRKTVVRLNIKDVWLEADKHEFPYRLDFLL